jgi:MYXO-CTERM domain-containing protein
MTRLRPALLALPLIVAPHAALAAEHGDSPERIQARAAWWHRQRALPASDLPPGALARAHDAFVDLARSTRDRHRHPGKPPSPPPPTWTLIGPAPLDTSQGLYETPNMSPGAGRASALAIDPNDPTTLYAGYAIGGVWKSTDGGATWTPLMDTAPTLAVGSIALDPSAPGTLYVGTGEPAPYIGYSGQGILKSTDGGKTFARIDGTTFDGLTVARLFLDGAEGTMYAAAFFGALGRGQSCNAAEDAKGQGLYRSTDGGKTWTLLKDGQIVDLEIDTTVTPRHILVSDYATGAYHSEDGGATFAPAMGLPTASDTPAATRIELALSPANPMIVYAGVGLESTGTVYVSQDGGQSFSPMAGAPDYCEEQCFYDNAVAADPTNAGTLYVGGALCGVWKTDDALDPNPVWVNVSLPNHDCGKSDGDWYSGYVHPDVHAITIDPMNPSRVFAANDGGLAESDDGGATWQQRNAGVATIQFYALCSAPDGTLYGGAQDQGFMTHQQAGLTWVGVVAADGGPCAVDPSDPMKILGSTEGASVLLTTTGFSTPPSYVFDADTSCQPLDPGCGDRVGFIAPLAGDPSTPGTYYVGTFRVWKTDDGGNGWKPMSDDVTAGKMTVDCSHVTTVELDDVLTTLVVAPSSPTTIYTGSQAGAIFATTDGGTTWTRMDKAPLPARWISGIAVDPIDPKTLFVSFSGFDAATPGRPGHVFRSTDGGNTWAPRDVGMDIPVDTLIAHPVAKDLLYAGTDFGALVSTDAGATWSVLGTGLPNAPVYALAYRPKPGALAAGTFGRSAWSITFGPGGLAAAPTDLAFTMTAGGAAPAAETVQITDTDTLGSVVPFTVKGDAPWLDVSPKSGTAAGAGAVTLHATVTAGQKAGTHTATLTLTPQGGTPVTIPVTLTVNAIPTTSQGGGCGCRAAGEADAPAWSAALAGAAIAALRRKARRGSKARGAGPC